MPIVDEELIQTRFCRYGKMSFFKNDNVIARSLMEYGEWAQAEIDFIAPLISPRDTVLDVGAFVGTHMIAFSTMVGPGGKVYAFEPQPASFELLKKNVNENTLHNVTILNVAVSDKDGCAQIIHIVPHTSGNFGAANIVGLGYETEAYKHAIDAISIDQLELDRCAVIKIDTEGMEAAVLKGAQETIATTRPVIVAECTSLEHGWPVAEFAAERDYHTYVLNVRAYNPNNFLRNPTNVFGAARETSFVLVPAERALGLRQHLLPTSSRPELIPILCLDDLALALIEKPQYKYEVLSKSKAAEVIGIDFWATEPEVEHLNEKVVELSSRLAYLKAGLNARLAQREDELNSRLTEREDELRNQLVRTQELSSQLATEVAERRSLEDQLTELRKEHENTIDRLQRQLHAADEPWSRFSVRTAKRYLRLPSDAWFIYRSGLFESDWYLQQNLDVSRAGANPLLHYLRRGSREGRDPNPLFDDDWYLWKNADVAAAGVNPLVHYLRRGAIERRDPSPLFNSDWYLRRYPEVAESGMNPLAHYLEKGASKRLDPSPLFDTDWYLRQYPDVAAAGANPLVHYLVGGAIEGRDPNPLFDTDWYLQKYPEVAKSGMNPLAHYLDKGASKGLDPTPLFDSDWYLQRYPEVAKSGMNPLAHYLEKGAREGLDPSPLFDTDWYLQEYPEVVRSGMNPLAHYLEKGASKRLDPSPLFDTDWYLRQYPDVAAAGINPLVHYLVGGATEGRDPNPLFDTDWYLQQYPEVAKSGMNPLAHYLEKGASKGLDPSPNFDTLYYFWQGPDVATSGMNPLAHYLQRGKKHLANTTTLLMVDSIPDAVALPEGVDLQLLSAEGKQGSVSKRMNSGLAPSLIRPLTIIVPIYNAARDLQLLVESLQRAVPEPVDGLSFLFLDDASSDYSVGELLHNCFFARDDVLVFRQKQNIGFVRNVNAGLLSAATTAPSTDFLILNSDTRVFPGFFSVLQREAYSSPRVASVTPLTNNGTITSLLRWPIGSELPDCLSAEAVASSVSELALESSANRIPTGVGHCMYIRREAFARIGLLDEAFGAGYGEECDWCRRGVKLRFEHLVTARTFVYHSGAKSFGIKNRDGRIGRNHTVLLEKHPEYEDAVSSYVWSDPLKFHRIAILLHALHHYSSIEEIHLLTLHADPDRPEAGGTEAHVRELRSALLRDNRAVLTLAASGDFRFVLRGMCGSEVFLQESVHRDLLPWLVQLLEHYVSHLHVHHTLNWPAGAIMALTNSSIPNKTVSIHDFWFLCPSINLVANTGNFCGVEPNFDQCNRCLREKWRHPTSIQDYRRASLDFLSRFDSLIFPSSSTVHYFERAFADDWEQFRSKVTVLGHDLSYIFEAYNNASAVSEAHEPRIVTPNRIAFIGGIGEHKGSKVVLDAIPLLLEDNFEVEILGKIYPPVNPNLENVSVTAYSNAEQLLQLLHRTQPEFICFPSIWAETYCFVFFEGLIFCETAIPIVGPYGNPADVSRLHGLGPVMSDCTAPALVEAVYQARHNSIEFRHNIMAFIAKLRTANTAYIRSYLDITDKATAPRVLKLLAGDSLSDMARINTLLVQNEATQRGR